MKNSKKLALIAVIVLSSLFLAYSSHQAYAETGWIGDGGTSEGPSGGGGGGGGACDSTSGRLDCTGLSWIFYEYVGPDPNTFDATYYFPDENEIGDDKLSKISPLCATYGEGTGFWHYGRNIQANQQTWSVGGYFGTTWRNALNRIGSNYTYRTFAGSWGHFRTTSRDVTSRKNTWFTGPWHTTQTLYDGSSMQPLGQELYKGTTRMYKARWYSQNTTESKYNAFEAFKIAYSAYYNKPYRGSDIDSSTYAFCAGPELGKGGKYDGTVTAKANGVSGSIELGPNDETFTLSFEHNIKRNQDNYSGVSTNNYNITNHFGNKNGTERFNAGDQSMHNVWSVSNRISSPNQGGQATYCTTMHYDSNFDDNGNGNGQTIAQACVIVKRKGNTTAGQFAAGTNCQAWGAGQWKGNGCNREFDTNSRNWVINHVGTASSNVNGATPNGTPAGLVAGGSGVYAHSQLAYGVANVTCVRSLNPYTQFWWAYDGNWQSSGPTLTQTGSQDLPHNHPNENNYHYVRTWYEPVRYCNLSNGLPCAEGTSGCNCRDDTVPHDVYERYYDGCEDGRTYWHDFNGDGNAIGAHKTWNEYETTKDDNLLLRDQEKVSIQRCSTMSVNSSWTWKNANDSPTGSYRDMSSACSTITRWRRHIKFEGDTNAIRADTGTRDEASTARSDGYELDVTNSDGKFTITFEYIMNRLHTTQVKDDGAENYTVTDEWGSYETIAPAEDGTNVISTIYSQNGTYNIYHDYGSFTTTEGKRNEGEKIRGVAGANKQTVKGMLYYGQRVKICGNVKYGNSVRETDDGSEIESWDEGAVGCIYVKRNQQNCGNVVGSNNPGYSFSHLSGYNVARIGVHNSSISNDYKYTSWTPNQAHTSGVAYTNTEIFARPGDTVRYKIDYCMGANYAHAVHEANGVNDGGVDTTMHAEGDSSGKTNGADTTDRIDANKRSNYLFGNSLGSYDGTKTAPVIFNFIKRYDDGRINEEESIKDENNKNTKYSPQGVGTIYSCPIGGGTTNGTNDYYQIAGKVVNNNGDYSTIDGCSSNRTQSLDVGRTLSEKIIWTDMSFDKDVYHARLNGDYLSNAYIRVPYNYTAKPFVTTNNSPKGTVQIGGKLTTTPGIAVFPRKNCALADGVNLDGCNTNNSGTATYATVTKPTTVTFKAYINNESRTFQTDSYVVRANTKSNRNGSTAGGTYATANLNGGGTKLDNDYIVDVPNNVNPGDKICVKMTITPADSHNDPTWATVHGASRASAGAEDTSRDTYTYWALREDGTSTATAVSCSTAVKRPTISVEDSNLYSASNITTSVVSRNNYVYNGGNARNAGNLDYYLFGSWSEYGIFGKVTTGSDGSVNISTLGTASGASLGYSQTSYLGSHKTSVTGYNAQPLTVVTYNGGPKNGTYEYNYSRITHNSSQTRIVYEYETKEDGSRYYRLASKTNQTIAPSSYTFANSPIVNAADSRGVASKATKVCTHSTQTFANVDCDDGKIGSDKIGADAVDVFTTNILDRYGDAKMPYTKTDGAEVINGYTNLTETSAAAEQLDGDEGAAMFKNIKGKAFLGYKDGHAVDYDSLAVKNSGNVEGVDTNLTAKSVMVYKADTVVINSSLIANNDEKTGSGDFRMPIIIANKVWFTGNPTRVDAIIIAKEELNTCKWNSYNDFLNNVLPSFPTKKDGLASNKANEMSSNICNNELRFTAPVVVKGKVIFNRTYGAGGADNGGDQMRRAEIFELNAATYLWSFAEMSRYSQAITTYSRELPSRY